MARLGQKVVIEYLGTLEDGTVVDDGRNAPLEATLGRAQIYPVMEREVATMEIGEERELLVAKEDAFGSYNPEAVRRLPIYSFSDYETIEPGMRVNAPSRVAPVTASAYVLEVRDNMVVLDFNHPLAGKDLRYWIRLVDVRD